MIASASGQSGSPPSGVTRSPNHRIVTGESRAGLATKQSEQILFGWTPDDTRVW